MYKVFFNDRTIYLDDSLPDMSRIGRDYVCAFENITDLRPQIRQFLEPGKKGNLYIYHDDQEILLKTFSQCFKRIKAAGGVVFNSQSEILFIFRRGKWDLPKGKMDKGETPQQTALREVQEECGLKDLEIGKYLCCTYHVYKLDEQFVLKKTGWYKMQYGGKEQPVPNAAESITQVRWVRQDEMQEIMDNTFPSIRDIIGIL